MNIALKMVIEKAINSPKLSQKLDEAIDTLYAKLIVNPIQKLWRNKKILGLCVRCNDLLDSKDNICAQCYGEERFY